MKSLNLIKVRTEGHGVTFAGLDQPWSICTGVHLTEVQSAGDARWEERGKQEGWSPAKARVAPFLPSLVEVLSMN